MSIEQAKAVRQKREFAQELEDIKDFEKKVVGGSEGRSSRKKLGSAKEDVESSDEDEDDEEDQVPRKKRAVCNHTSRLILWMLTPISPCRTREIASTLSSRIKVMMIEYWDSMVAVLHVI